MHKPINGFTKEKMIEIIRSKNNGKRSINLAGKSCVYLSDDGNRCAVGCFIPDNHPALNALIGMQTLLYIFPDLENHMPLSEMPMLFLQRVHDKCPDDVDVRERLIDWIEKYVE